MMDSTSMSVADVADWLETRLRAMPKPGDGIREARLAAASLMGELSGKFRAITTANGSGQRVQMLGISATGSAGIVAACQNWIAAVRKEVAA